VASERVEGVSEKGLRVLVADEDRETLETLAQLLRDMGHDVLPKCISVREAVDIVAVDDPDIALVRLDRDDGHALALIGEIVAYANGPVVALLDHDDPEFLAIAAREGIFAFGQPVTPGSVKGAIEVAMRRHAEAEALVEKVEQLETALERKAVIERAKGILMERHGIDDDAAFGRLRDHARANNRKLYDVARAVGDGHALLPRS
jgi:AmiR/NasT family two-component response regulator